MSIDEITSLGIRKEMERQGVSHADLLGTTGAGDSRIAIYQIGGVRVAETNGEPVWEESDPEGFAAAAEMCGL